MPAGARDAARPGDAWYSYAVVRVVPRVERGEFINVGVILFARTRRFLEARLELDPQRLRALAPDIDLAAIAAHLAQLQAVAAGAPEGGDIAGLPASERFHWLTAPRSTVIQTSPVHVGCCEDPASALEDLIARLVRTGRQG
jgi:hypothetical protein